MAGPDVWLRGPVHGIPPLLMPCAHALMQAREDVIRHAAGLSAPVLAARPGDGASAAFHLFHAANALDRLMTYARGEALLDLQRAALVRERNHDVETDPAALVRCMEEAIDRALRQLRCTPERALLDDRAVGAAGHRSTVLGLVFHAAEHTTRHVGQFISTIQWARVTVR